MVQKAWRSEDSIDPRFEFVINYSPCRTGKHRYHETAAARFDLLKNLARYFANIKAILNRAERKLC